MLLLFRWLGEKYDGLRCCWNPNEKVVYLSVFYFFSPFSLIYYYLLSEWQAIEVAESMVAFLSFFYFFRRGIMVYFFFIYYLLFVLFNKFIL